MPGTMLEKGRDVTMQYGGLASNPSSVAVKAEYLKNHFCSNIL